MCMQSLVFELFLIKQDYCFFVPTRYILRARFEEEENDDEVSCYAAFLLMAYMTRNHWRVEK